MLQVILSRFASFFLLCENETRFHLERTQSLHNNAEIDSMTPLLKKSFH